MQQSGQTAGWGGPESKRVEAVVETLANLHSDGESLAQVAHDARNMVTALGLYCDLLEEPGVLGAPFRHYGSELRLVATASRRLVEKLVALDFQGQGSTATDNAPSSLRRISAEAPGRIERPRRWDLMPAQPIENLAAELLANCNLLSALAGPSIPLAVDAEGGGLAVRLTGEDLTRVLVNLIKNAAEAMPSGGRIQIGLRECLALAGAPPKLLLTIEDSGQGIATDALDKIFEPGFTTHTDAAKSADNWPSTHRGLGLAITRSIVEKAGGRIHAGNRPETGARFEIELPVRSH